MKYKKVTHFTKECNIPLTADESLIFKFKNGAEIEELLD